MALDEGFVWYLWCFDPYLGFLNIKNPNRDSPLINKVDQFYKYQNFEESFPIVNALPQIRRRCGLPPSYLSASVDALRQSVGKGHACENGYFCGDS